MSDNDKVVSKQFFETLCALSGVEQHKGVIYRPHSNPFSSTHLALSPSSNSPRTTPLPLPLPHHCPPLTPFHILGLEKEQG